MIVGCLGDSITAGSPLWDPDDAVRAGIESPDERSQWQYWAMRAYPGLELRNHGVYGERTDQIAERLEEAIAGVDALVVQGGINDVVQGRPVDEAARHLTRTIERARAGGVGLVFVADVLPWNNGDARAATDIARLNGLIFALACGLSVTRLPFNATLSDPGDRTRMRAECTDDGDHPSIEGHRLLGERAFRL
jgi:lysophospholipase L1-like esterase